MHNGVAFFFYFFFFSSRRRHTRSLYDWSSDVCSSDLSRTLLVADGGSSQQVKAFENASATGIGTPLWTFGHAGGYANGPAVSDDKFFFMTTGRGGSQIGRASCRERE